MGEATALLPSGRLDAWIAAVRKAHISLDKDATWIKNSDILNTWTARADGRGSQTLRRYTEEELYAVFCAIDVDNNGTIDKNELLAALGRINSNAADETAEGMLAFADADGDCLVDFDEFRTIIVGMPRPDISPVAVAQVGSPSDNS